MTDWMCMCVYICMCMIEELRYCIIVFLGIYNWILNSLNPHVDIFFFYTRLPSLFLLDLQVSFFFFLGVRVYGGDVEELVRWNKMEWNGYIFIFYFFGECEFISFEFWWLGGDYIYFILFIIFLFFLRDWMVDGDVGWLSN